MSKRTNKLALLVCLNLFFIVGNIASHIALIVAKENQLRSIAEATALNTARTLPLVNAGAAHIENVRRKLTDCRVEGEAVRAFEEDQGELLIKTLMIDHETGVRVTISEEWTSYVFRLLSLPAKPITGVATASLQGSGKVQLVELENGLLSENPVGHLANKPSERCGA